MSAFWDKLKKESAKDATPEEAKKENKSSAVDADVVKSEKDNSKQEKVVEKKEKKAKKGKKKSFPKEKALLISSVIVGPKVSESAMNQQALGKYVFFVSKDATRNEVAKAVEAMYGVHVRKVNIQLYDQRAHQFRGHKGKKNSFKKAIVSLSKGESIDVFSE